MKNLIKLRINMILFLFTMLTTVWAKPTQVNVNKYGIKSNGEDCASQWNKLIEHVKTIKNKDGVIINFPKGTYNFYPDNASTKEYFISNHDHWKDRKVGIFLEDLENVTLNGNGSEFIFHGRMLPLSLLRSKKCTLKNFSIDFADPQLVQVEVINVDKGTQSFTANIGKGRYKLQNGRLSMLGRGWELGIQVSMFFDENKRLSYLMSDVGYGPSKVEEVEEGVLKFYNWQINRVKPGMRVILRNYARPAPGIFMSHNKNTKIKNVTIHFAEGMGLLAQVCENITLDKFNVSLRGKKDKRYFTTQADASHFSGCKGEIVSQNGLYEGMMDDAINVHGTYLRVEKRVSDKILQGRYMHHQAWGFEWGSIGDSVQFVEASKMEIVSGGTNKIKRIKAVDKSTINGARLYEIEFENSIPAEVIANKKYGIENLTWTPSVVFRKNLIRNNRARGSLFSTPKKVICEENIFDFTHGAAILLCGDCNGWFETGSCRDVAIRKNKFINALSASTYQFTNAIIGIDPEIPRDGIKLQKKYFHSKVIIEDNYFETFDKPLVFAESVDGLIFRNNTVKKSNVYPPFHRNKFPFWFLHSKNVKIENNNFYEGFDYENAVKQDFCEPNAVIFNK